MATLPKLPERSPEWSAEAMAMAAQAKVVSGAKLEQLVVRLQRHSGRPKEACWRFIIQYGIKGQQDHRRWTETEFEIVRGWRAHQGRKVSCRIERSCNCASLPKSLGPLPHRTFLLALC